MDTLFRAIETTAQVSDEHHLALDVPLPQTSGRVRVIILLAPEQEISEAEWLYAAKTNPAFAFLNDPREDVYSVTDGKPFNEQG